MELRPRNGEGKSFVREGGNFRIKAVSNLAVDDSCCTSKLEGFLRRLKIHQICVEESFLQMF